MLINATQKAKSMHARRNPNLSVSAAAYSQLSPSVTSATFLSPTVAARRGLLSPSPPPSPNRVETLSPRRFQRKQPLSSQSRLVKRLLLGAIGVTLLVWLVLRQLYADQSQIASYEDGDSEWEMVEGNSLPLEPSIVIVEDIKGNAKWTVSIPESYDFPLRPTHYKTMCHQAMEMSSQLYQEAKANSGIIKRMVHLNYYQKDRFYLDVQEAEQQGLLPPSKTHGRPSGFVDDEAIANDVSFAQGLPVCDKSMTFVMETTDAGFGNTLLRLWMSYGLAMKENRTFFIDDTRWPYGKYSTYFMPPPAAGCSPPPRSQMVPCPHNARHIVVSGATVAQTFGHAFTEEWEDPRKMRVQRQHKIFALLRAGYEALFKLREDDAQYVSEHAASLYGPVTETGGISIGLHVRHGDKHPLEYQYQEDYIPLDRYMDTARDIYIERVENSNMFGLKSKTKAKRHTSSKIVVASDDPQVYDSPEMGPNAIRAQDRIILATKATLEAAQGHKNPWIDEITGWEGGFYRDVFFSLGRPVGNANDMNALDEQVPEGAMKIRELVGRAYLMDLAMVSKADTVVCTVSSIGCRILAVMLGWDNSFNKGNWRNIDGEFEWKGIVW
ncbi:hypothetical protein K491DRAFT_721631 [Lophiostoma macrostomum CBS 122681]|uniref:Uncharacterized protein n=1 Tax=Lophiostoma macrostomum CBS 122681 TaxID=1314788 RepID=A0A6A6SNP9_9PLEO|nr:hypothetical protein K491DRAFT_721631 [Lophiostoma macrostomum CBS 122681]